MGNRNYEIKAKITDYTLINNHDNKEEISIYDDDEIMRISLFMKKIIDAIQIDDDVNISEEETDILGNVLHFSTITSVSDNNSHPAHPNQAGHHIVLA